MPSSRWKWLVLSAVAAVAMHAQDALDPLPNSQANPNLPPQPEVGKGSIAGVVVNARTHEPVRKAHVMLNGAAQLSAVTDSSGNFTFRALPAGGYFIMANHEDYPVSAPSARQLQLAEGQEQTDVQVTLQPGASVSGHVVDEDGNPVQGCFVNASRYDHGQGGAPRLSSTSGNNTDSDGAYRLHGLMQGRYVLRAQCGETFPAPHGFMRRGDPLTPVEGYSPVTRGDESGTAGSGMLIQAGAELTGMNFEVKRVPMFSVRGNLSGGDGLAGRGTQLVLISRDEALGEQMPIPTHMDPRRGIFRFTRVPAGTYEIVATATSNDHSWQARQTIEVGKTPVTEVNLQLSAGPSLTGVIRSDDPNVSLSGQQISLTPLTAGYRGPFPMATVGADGTFTFKSILPGHFRFLGVQGGSYVKTLSIGGHEISPDDIEIADGAAGPLQITLGTKVGKVELGIDPAPVSGATISGLLVPVSGGTPQVSSVMPQPGNATLQFGNVPPGKYRALLLATPNAWVLANSPELLKQIESRSVPLEVSESGDVHATASVVPDDELQKAMDAVE